jgi:cell division protein FtsI/penicillin-binding protein 2
MKFRSYFLLFVLVFVSSVPACKSLDTATPQASQNTPQPAVTRTLPQVEPTVYKTPKAELTAQVFLNAWKAEDYSTMYSLLTPASQDALAPEKFSQRYQDAAVAMTMQKLDYEILSKMTNPSSAQVAYRVTFHTKMIGDMTRDITMNLSLEKGAWRVQWDDGLLLPDLHGGNTLALDLKSPTRGNIYDRNGVAVAAASDIFSLGIIKGETNPDQESRLLNELSDLTGKPAEWIKALYNRESIYQGTYVPVGEATRDQILERYNVLSGLQGLRMNEYKGRYYFDGGIAPHVTGYVAAIQAEEKDQYLRDGFRLDDRVGKAGLELWAENSLLGQRGASLYVNDPQGSPITRLAQVDSKPSQSVYMTIDSKLQLEAQKAIAGFNGAIVVVERDSGRVLAMVSSPGFDPNAFEYQNYNSTPLLGSITGDGLNRLYNRASGNGYPLGSVFKIITTAAALESGLFKWDTTLDCQWDWTEIPGLTLTDWTKDKGYDPSGVLTLEEGLMRSCNPWFYHIGYTLYKQGHPNDISNMARAFGLGSKTGIQGLDFDETGNIPDPVDEQSAALIAIGQDKVLVNPLQVARFVAAVGNGGTLYRPQLVEKITDPDGNASFTFKPEVQGKLPVKPENLQIIQEAMRWVVSSSRGTAVRAFSGLNIPVNGKTGTAQNDFPGHPHAWFAGYTDTGGANKPDIAFAVIAEYAGEGSDIAAPIARRLLEVYFLGQPQRVYPWESRIYVTRTPTPDGTETPISEKPQPQQPQPGEANTPVPTESNFNVRTATPSP